MVMHSAQRYQQLVDPLSYLRKNTSSHEFLSLQPQEEIKMPKITSETPPEPSSHIVFTFTSAISSPVVTCIYIICCIRDYMNSNS